MEDIFQMEYLVKNYAFPRALVINADFSFTICLTVGIL